MPKLDDQSFRIPKLKLQIGGQGRRETINGVEHAIYPVVMLVEGVHHGAVGSPVFYSASVLEASAPDWEGVPLPVYHPRNAEGDYMLCRDPGVTEQWSIGYVANVAFNEGRLKAEVFINVQRSNQKHPLLLSQLDNGEQMDVSTGLLALDDGTSSIWNNVHYSASITRIAPDHLALLPGAQGACSWDDGCGLRANAQEVQTMPQDGKGDLPKINVGIKAGSKKSDFAPTLNINELSHEALHRLIRNHIDSMDIVDSNGEYIKIHYVRAIYDSYFIFSEESENGVKLFRQGYSAGPDNTLILGETVTPVREDVSYIPIEANATHQEVNVMPEAKQCCPQKVEALIANQASAFVEADRTWLSEQDEGYVDKMLSTLQANETKVEVEPKINKVVEVAPKVNAEPTTEEYIANAPAGIRGVLTQGLAQHNARKVELIAAIKANALNTFDDVALGAMDLNELESIATLSGHAVPAAQPTFAGMQPALGAPEMNAAPVDEEPYVAPILNLAADA